MIILILPQCVRDSLEQEYAEVHIQNVPQYALLSIVQDLRTSPRSKDGRKRKTGLVDVSWAAIRTYSPLEYREAL